MKEQLKSIFPVFIFTYNTQFHRSTNASPFGLLSSHHPPELSTLSNTREATLENLSESFPYKLHNLIQQRILELSTKSNSATRKS